MAVCIYDNPSNWRRESWVNEELAHSLCGTAINSTASQQWPFYMRRFEPGRIDGDPSAMKAKRAQGVGNEK